MIRGSMGMFSSTSMGKILSVFASCWFLFSFIHERRVPVVGGGGGHARAFRERQFP